MVRFCPKCGVLLTPTKNGSGTLLACRKCGHTEEQGDEQGSYVIQKRITHTPKDKITIIDDKVQNINTMPTTRVDCPKCHHHIAAYWQVQTRAADEGSTIFFRCLKCNHTWREY